MLIKMYRLEIIFPVFHFFSGVFKQVINQTCVELKESLAENTIDYMAAASMGNQGQRNTIKVSLIGYVFI